MNMTHPEPGVYSEVGKLREVLVHRPDLSLTPADARQLPRIAVRRRDLGEKGPAGA